MLLKLRPKSELYFYIAVYYFGTMRIGFDAKRLFNNFTGLGNYSRFVVKSLVDYYPQHHYTLYSPKIKDHPETKSFRTNPRLLIRTPPRWVKGSGFGSFWRSVNLGNIASRDGMDIFHGLSNELPVSKPKGLKTVVTIHDLIFVRHPELYGKIDAAIYRKKLENACESADSILAISRQTANDLTAFMKIDKDRIQVVYQGCDEIFKQKYPVLDIQNVLRKYNLPEDYVLTVGTLEQRKNALLLLKAATLLDKKINIVLVGKRTSYQDQLDEYISSHHLKDRVYFIHDVSFVDLPRIYKGARVFVYPSRFEGFGIPILEAIHAGVPVIAATGSCLEEAGGPSCVYVHPDDHEALAKNIESLINDATLRNESLNGSLKYVQRFEPANIAKDLIEVYEKVKG